MHTTWCIRELVGLAGIFYCASGATCTDHAECDSDCFAWTGHDARKLSYDGECAAQNTIAGAEGCHLRSSCQCVTGTHCACTDGAMCGENRGCCCSYEDVVDDPHMIGFHDQHIDWIGEDGGWYVLLSDVQDPVQVSVRLTAPLPDENPERQLIAGFALMYGEGHSVIIETKHPYTTEADECPTDSQVPCLSEQALHVNVDGAEYPAVPANRAPLPGDATFTAFNLPAESQPYGGDVIWAAKTAEMEDHRRLTAIEDLSGWVFGWSESTAAPSHCDKIVAESGAAGLLGSHSKHAVFRIETPTISVRLHHGKHHQGGEVMDDGCVLTPLDFWQMNLHLESFELDFETVTGILGETSRPVLDEVGQPVTSGIEALRGEVGDYRVSGSLASDFVGVEQ